MNALGEVEEIIRKPVVPEEPAIYQCPVGSVEPAFFAGPEGEVAADLHSGWNQVTEEQVGAQMHVMVSINVGWGLSKETRELLALCLVRIRKFSTQKRIV